MVIEPDSLIFFSVPSCASACVAKIASTASSVERIMVSPLGLCEKFYLLNARGGIPYTLGDRGEQRRTERRIGLDQVQEHLAVDAEQDAVALGGGVGGARRLVDER